jgi:predicted ATPase
MVHYGFECLKTLGVHIEQDPTPEMVDEARKKLHDLMGDRKVSDLINIPSATDPRARVYLPFPWL